MLDLRRVKKGGSPVVIGMIVHGCMLSLAGECDNPASTTCAWKLVETIKQVNATCQAAGVKTTIESLPGASKCFSKCPVRFPSLTQHLPTQVRLDRCSHMEHVRGMRTLLPVQRTVWYSHRGMRTLLPVQRTVWYSVIHKR